MQYNLLESHKEFARWLVEQYRASKLGEDFLVVFDSKGLAVIQGQTALYSLDEDTIPTISVNALKALVEEKLILLEELHSLPPFTFGCSLLSRIFTAVDTNFGELETDLKPRSDGVGGLGLSLPKFSQLLARDFSQSELNDLLFNMGIESAEIFGNSLSENTRETVKYAQRHGRLLELLIRSAKLRPRTDWSQLYE